MTPSSQTQQPAVNQSSVIDRKEEIANSIRELITKNPFFIPKESVDQLLRISGFKVDELLGQLIPFVKENARPFISNYQVGVVGLAQSGNIYIGVNIEFPGFHLNQTVHGEQFLVVNARNHKESWFQSIALSAAPCGFCRQFLNEISNGSSMQILIPGSPPTNLSSLLPDPFGPQDLGLSGGLLTPGEDYQSDHADPLTKRAIEAAKSSYAPYTHSFSGVAIQTKDGQIFSGSYLENAAFNPTLSPFQTAIVSLVMGQKKFDEISEVVLVESSSLKTSHAPLTESMLKKIAESANFRVEKLPFSP